MYTVNEVESCLQKVAVKLTDNFGKGGFNSPVDDVNIWEWPLGVGMFGLYNYYRLCGDKKYLDYMINWYDSRIKEGLPKPLVNTTAPMLALACIAEETKNEQYLELCRNSAKWIMNNLERTTDGGFQHTVAGPLNTDQQLWDDTLYMAVLFLAKAGTIFEEQDFINESEKQFLVHIKYLFDRQTGLWFHGWTFNGRHNFSATRWARGNCWITSGIVDYLNIVNPQGFMRDYLIDTLQAQVEALAKLQDKSGLWHTVLNDETSYLEASATSGFGYGILKGVRKGYLDKKYLEVGLRALEGIMKVIDEDGTVGQVSDGTPIFNNEQNYKEIPITSTGYGQGLTLMFLGECLHHLK